MAQTVISDNKKQRYGAQTVISDNKKQQYGAQTVISDIFTDVRTDKVICRDTILLKKEKLFGGIYR